MKKRFFIISTLLLLGFFAISSCAEKESTSQEGGSSVPSQQDSHINSDYSSNVDIQSSDNKQSSDTGTSVTSVSLNYEELSLYLGKTVTLKANIEPNTALNKNVTWESSNVAVATVNNGTVKTLSVGETVIKVTTENGGLTASCKLTVVEKESSGTYVPDTNDSEIFFATDDTLSNATYDSSKDEYTFSVSKSYKQIYVNSPDKVIILELNGVTIQNGLNSPIYVESCDTLEISAKKSTVNYIKDTRPIYTEEEEDQGKGAIYVEDGDLKLKGTGTLNITSTYYNGIHCKDDVKVQKQTLNVTAPNHGIRGNDSVTITSGTINITCGGDGLHSDNSDISSKGNQRGNVTVNGGTLTINSWGDAVQASYNAIFEQTDTAVPIVLDAKTNKYSSYTGETVETSQSSFYLKMNSSTYSNGQYTYAAYINNNWYPATYKGTQSSGGQGGPGGYPGGGPGGGGPGGGSSTYYFYEIEKPSNATSFTLYRFKNTSYSLENYNAVSDAKAFNNAYDTVTISVSSGKINFSSWSNYSSGNSNSADISAKGIKAENEIYIKDGTISIKSYDDAIHANNDGILENGDTPLGNIHISGGSLSLNASDDAIHADYQLNISGGTINVETAYEGLEGNVINVSGGDTFVYATDDGVNATKGNVSPSVTVSGGLLDVAVPTNGDTDGIDSNGTFVLKGGVVVVKGPGSASSSGSPAAALDTDGAVTLTSGTIAIFGGIERAPSTSLTKTLCSSSSVSAGFHTISFSNGTSYSTTLKNSTNGCVVYSELGTATLK